MHKLQISSRYGIDITGFRAHEEADELAQILALLNGYVGKARVIDRLNQTTVFDGTVNEVRESIRRSLFLNGTKSRTKQVV